MYMTPGAGPHGRDLLGDLGAHHPGHDHVGYQRVDRAVVPAGQLDRVRTAGRGQHLVAAADEDASGDFPDAVLVLDHQDDLAVPGHVRLVRGSRNRDLWGGRRQRDTAGGAESLLGIEPHLAPGLRDDPVDRRKPQAGLLARRLVVKNGSNACSSVAGSMPIPSSLTRSRT
jgi:hypothetical protein